MAYQYLLEVHKGKVVKEEGYFYRAGNFILTAQSTSFEINFVRNHDHAVVYTVLEKGTAIQELTHPDYVPEISPGDYVAPDQLAKEHLPIYAALVQLGIAKEVSYVTYFQDDATAASLSYTVQQPQLIS